PLHNYEVIFDKTFKDSALQNNYKEYLKQSHSLEPLLFLLDVLKFKMKPSFDGISPIIEKYITEGAKFEINISGEDRRNIMASEDSTEPMNKMFDSAFNAVYRELKSDSFHRYVNSELFKRFIERKGEAYLETISINLTSSSGASKMMPSGFDTCHISDRDLECLVRLNDCVSDWTSLSPTKIGKKERDHYPYVSKHRYLMSDNPKSGQLITKLTGRLNFSAEHFAHCVNDEQNDRFWKVHCPNFKIIGINEEHEYAHATHYSDLVLSKLMRPRDQMLMHTLLYDTERRCYMFFSKTTLAEDKLKYRGPGKYSDVSGFNCLFIYDLGENKCRYCYLIFTDAGLKYMDLVYKLIAKGLSKKMHDQYIEMCAITPTKTSCISQTLEIFRSRYLSTPGAVKTWAQDLLKERDTHSEFTVAP
ncbi:hypothetical protein AKO1_002766, partial [Acrasis kona]